MTVNPDINIRLKALDDELACIRADILHMCKDLEDIEAGKPESYPYETMVLKQSILDQSRRWKIRYTHAQQLLAYRDRTYAQ